MIRSVLQGHCRDLFFVWLGGRQQQQLKRIHRFQQQQTSERFCGLRLCVYLSVVYFEKAQAKTVEREMKSSIFSRAAAASSSLLLLPPISISIERRDKHLNNSNSRRRRRKHETEHPDVNCARIYIHSLSIRPPIRSTACSNTIATNSSSSAKPETDLVSHYYYYYYVTLRINSSNSPAATDTVSIAAQWSPKKL